MADTDDIVLECCGAPTEWDPLREGYSYGGLALRGWHVCGACGTAYLSRRSRPIEKWKLAAGGRSVDTGTFRIRAERGEGDVVALMARIVRLPELELALQRIANASRMAEIDEKELNTVRWELRQIAEETRRLANDLDSPELQSLQGRLENVVRRLDRVGGR